MRRRQFWLRGRPGGRKSRQQRVKALGRGWGCGKGREQKAAEMQ